MTDQQIADGLRQLVVAKILDGWYTFMWSDGRHWTICPKVGKTRTYTRVEMTDYLVFAGGMAA